MIIAFLHCLLDMSPFWAAEYASSKHASNRLYFWVGRNFTTSLGWGRFSAPSQLHLQPKFSLLSAVESNYTCSLLLVDYYTLHGTCITIELAHTYMYQFLSM